MNYTQKPTGNQCSSCIGVTQVYDYFNIKIHPSLLGLLDFVPAVASECFPSTHITLFKIFFSPLTLSFLFIFLGGSFTYISLKDYMLFDMKSKAIHVPKVRIKRDITLWHRDNLALSSLHTYCINLLFFCPLLILGLTIS